MTDHRSPTLTRRALLRGCAALPLAAGAIGLLPTLPAVAQATLPPELVAGNTAFALALLAAMRQAASGNLLFSPYSVSQALAMTYAGARGETATQMAETLSFGLEQPALHEAFAALDADLAARGDAEDGPGALRVANALWGEQEYPFSETYSEVIERWYGAGLRRADFSGAPDEARGDINAWVAERTEDRIQDIVPPGAITAATRLVLANAIFFYGAWRHQFEREDTRDEDFHLLDGGTATVPFMYQQARFGYARGDGFEAVELSYAQDGLALTVIAPDVGRFEDFEAGLDSGALETAIGGIASTEIKLHLSKFEFDFGASLADALRALGMTDAFDLGLADFSGMVDGTPPEPLAIGDVLHKAFISVDEEGTEAAAATVVIGVTSAAPLEQEPPEVRIDRPFLFAIRDTVTGTLLFLGRVLDPSA